MASLQKKVKKNTHLTELPVSLLTMKDRQETSGQLPEPHVQQQIQKKTVTRMSPSNGISYRGCPPQGCPTKTPLNGTSYRGCPPQGCPTKTPLNAISYRGCPPQGCPTKTPLNGTSYRGCPPQGTGLPNKDTVEWY